MALKHKKTRILRRNAGSSRFWSLANIRRQLKKKKARGQSRRNSEFYNLQLSAHVVDQSITTEMIQETVQ